MDIGIIGGGNVGSTLGRAWSRAGHVVRIGSRAPSPRDAGGTYAEVARWAEVVVFAVPGAATGEIAASLGAALDGKVVIDASNRVGAPRLNSVAEIVAAAPGAHVYRAFSTVGWEVMAEPVLEGERADLFYCGPDARRQEMTSLIGDVGFRAVWMGDEDELETVDGLARAWFALALRRGLGRHLALRLIGT